MTGPPVIGIKRTEGADHAVDLPSYATAEAAGADLRANFPEGKRDGLDIAPCQRVLVPTGLFSELPAGWELQVRPRSGLALKHGLTLLNTPGTIDSDYRGPIGVIMINLGLDPYHIQHGERIAQLIVSPAPQARFAEIDEVSETARGAGGFGSTGVS